MILICIEFVLYLLFLIRISWVPRRYPRNPIMLLKMSYMAYICVKCPIFPLGYLPYAEEIAAIQHSSVLSSLVCQQR